MRSNLLKQLKLISAGLFLLGAFSAQGCTESTPPVVTTTETKAAVPLWGDAPFQKPSCIKGVHLTAWYAGSKKGRAHIDKLLEETELNTVVIAVKEIQGDIYMPGIKIDGGAKAYVAAIPDLKAYVHALKERGIWTIARIVVFKDSHLPKEKPEWAVRSSSPIPMAVEKGYEKNIWVDNKGLAWADPTHPAVWEYNIEIAEYAAKLGFQEVQYDYIRFPSDGKTKFCVYNKPHTRAESSRFLAEFLKRSAARLKPLGVETSIDVFGLVGSTNDDMGIGQKLSDLLNDVDAVSPMMYPSHYAPGELGVADPNRSPYDTIFFSIRDTQRVMGSKKVVLRPYFQDFSLGVKYTPQMVRDQIQAAADLGVNEWLLWSPSCRYTRDALEPFSQSLNKPQPASTPLPN